MERPRRNDDARDIDGGVRGKPRAGSMMKGKKTSMTQPAMSRGRRYLKKSSRLCDCRERCEEKRNAQTEEATASCRII